MEPLQTIAEESLPSQNVVVNAGQPEIPSRFQASRKVLFIDAFMTRFIRVGGIVVIVAVLGILIFIFSQVLPLFQRPTVKPMVDLQLPNGQYTMMGIDEWGELPFVVDDQGRGLFVDLPNRKSNHVDFGFTEPKTFTAVRYNQLNQEMIFGTSDGLFSLVPIGYEATFENNQRRIQQHAKATAFFPVSDVQGKIDEIDYGRNDTDGLVAAIQEWQGKRLVRAVVLSQTKTLLGAGELTTGDTYDLTPEIESVPGRIAVNTQASEIAVANDQGDVFFFERGEDGVKFIQKFRPFDDLSDPTIRSLNFLLGGVSLVFTSSSGANRIFSLYVPEGGERRFFGRTKDFQDLHAGADYYSSSVRNKAFLVGATNIASLRYATTADVRWEKALPFSATLGVIGGKYNRLVFLDTKDVLHTYELNDPHPEASFHALFGKIWYEGYSQPQYSWQSTGSTDDFEPKLSMVPLLIGTLKGTFYAMLFATPIALLAAIYTSQFLHPKFRILVKPTMEIMASLPSVVLGFLAALWLAPVLETRIPTILIALILLPTLAMFFGWGWSRLPVEIRVRIKTGYEWMAFIPLFFASIYFAWIAGPVIEKWLFASDFRGWWVHATGLPFEQRNSLVVGFMMGFAVIPIIFTITEDALSNVPATLRSGSLALGASRWQTALRIVLPTASAGIFSAVMIGLGRAIGETMIVVMATGNTPIMNFNIFSGMRTLSANIAVELPEAPVHGTLYRTLFLGGLLLFLLTFFINTLAELLRQHLREKYRTV